MSVKTVSAVGKQFKLVRVRTESCEELEVFDHTNIFRVDSDSDTGVVELYGVKGGVPSATVIRGFVSVEIYGEKDGAA